MWVTNQEAMSPQTLKAGEKNAKSDDAPMKLWDGNSHTPQL